MPERGTFAIRPIEPRDDAAMARIIRAVMPEFGAVGCGFAINDPEVDWMHRAYAAPGMRIGSSRSRAKWSEAGALRPLPAAMPTPANCARCTSCQGRAASAPARR